MITNNKQIGLLAESWGVVNPTKNLSVTPISVSFQIEDLLINREENSNFPKFKIRGVNNMKEYCKEENQEYYGYVYLTIDQKHNKVYVGQSSKRVEKSKKYFGSGFYIKRIINSRGTYFLKKIILGVCDTREELLNCEYECKCFFDAWNPLVGYNISIKDYGGDNFLNQTEERKKEIRKNIGEGGKERYRKNPDLKIQISNIVKKRHKNLIWHEKWRQSIIQSNPKRKQTREKIWNSLSEEEKKIVKKKSSERTINLWINKSEYDKEKFIKKMIKVNNSEEHVRKSKESRKNPVYKENLSKKLKISLNTTEMKDKKSKFMKEQHKRPEIKKFHSEKMKKRWKDPTFIAMHKKIHRPKISFKIEEEFDFLLNKYNGELTIRNIIEEYNTSGDIVRTIIRKKIEEGIIIKSDTWAGKKGFIYRRK